MKHKTSELTGALLDAAVAKVNGGLFEISDDEWGRPAAYMVLMVSLPEFSLPVVGDKVKYRERIHLTPVDAGGAFLGVKQERDGWLARCTESFMNERGDKPLIAAMRAYVASKLGNEVEL